MAELSIFCALRIERLALGRATLVGMGPERAKRASLGRLEDGAAYAVCGVSGGLRVGVSAGDVVVADELRNEDGQVRRLPSARLVASELSQAGLKVHVGPLVSISHFANARERSALGERGALAVDMESFWLAERLGDHPLAVVRTIADCLDNGPVSGALPSLRALRRVRPALEAWARTIGPLRVMLASPRSFCAGVERAIEIVERAIGRFGPPVYVRRQIVHNAHVVSELEERGAVFVNELDEVPEGATVVLAAHGVSPEVRMQAERRPSLSVIDATCPLVAKVHHEARRFASQARRIVLIGHAGHEEVVGTMGEVPGGIDLVQGLSDVAGLDYPPGSKVAYLTQTTLAVDETAQIIDALGDRFDDLVGPSADDICYASQNRQDAVRELAGCTDLVLVVGSANSSNTARLVEVARREGTRAELVEDAGDLRLSWLNSARVVGVTAGASAPESLVKDLVEVLRSLGANSVEELAAKEETVHFTLPQKVR
ncbi:MAG: 4-hydroxy-3-methylbut-2-enyl diphosphate reductase [Acidimicrobiales bacterium]